MSDRGTSVAEKSLGDCGMIRPLTVREQLINDRARLQVQVDAVDAAIKALDEFPAFEKVHDAIVKTGIQHRLH